MLYKSKIITVYSLSRKWDKRYNGLMTKRMVTIMTAVLLMVMIGIGGAILYNFTKLGQSLDKGTAYSASNPPVYHFMAILDGTDPSFTEELKSGMDRASEDYSVVYELWSFNGPERVDEMVRQMDIGIEAQVDGILLQVSEDPRFEELVIKATRKNVPVITLAGDVPSQEKVSYISYNKYQMGSKIGRLLEKELAEAGKSGGTIAVLQNSTVFDTDQAFAIQDELSEGFVVAPVKVTSENERILNAEGLAISAMEEHEDLCAFICLSNEETAGVLQALKSTNRIGEILVVGSGSSQENLEAIQKGMLAATIIPDIRNIGYEALFDLSKYNDGLFVSQYRDILVEIVDVDGLAAYLEKEAEHEAP